MNLTPEQIIRRVADQSFLICFESDKSGRQTGRRITRQMVGEALDELVKNSSETNLWREDCLFPHCVDGEQPEFCGDCRAR